MTDIPVGDGGLSQKELMKFSVDWDGLAATGLFPKITKREPTSPEVLPHLGNTVQVGDGGLPVDRVMAVDESEKFYVALHHGEPNDDQSTNEVSYKNYDRVAVPRGSGFAFDGKTITNALDIAFPECDGESVLASHISIGQSKTGRGAVLFKAKLDMTMQISPMVTPMISVGGLIIGLSGDTLNQP
jgi:hypothetical protein